MSAPIPGDPIYLGSFLANTHWYGVVGDGETPAMQVATMEAVGQNAVIALDALKGDKGDKGDPADVVKMQWDSAITASSQLPQNLNNTTDVGKAWWIGNLVYAWTGSKYITRPMGSPGQVGQTPSISVTMERVAPDGESTVQQSGTVLNPVLHFKIAAPAGPPGPAAAIVNALDYKGSKSPDDGTTLTWNAAKGGAEFSEFASKHPRLYSIPEAAFQTIETISVTSQEILSYTLPAQDYDYVPYVNGHFKAFGLELDSDPTIIDTEVMIGTANTFQRIGIGVSNRGLWNTVVPHFSDENNPSSAVAPGNNVARVPRNQTRTLKVSLINKGLGAYYKFDRAGAQLTVLMVPQD